MSAGIELGVNYYYISNFIELVATATEGGEDLWVDTSTHELFSFEEMRQWKEEGVIETKEEIDLRVDAIAEAAAEIVVENSDKLLGEPVFMGTAIGEEYYFKLEGIDLANAMFIVDRMHHIDHDGSEAFHMDAAIPFAYCDELRRMSTEEEEEWKGFFTGSSSSTDVIEMFFKDATPDEKKKVKDKTQVKKEPKKKYKLPKSYNPNYTNTDLPIVDLVDKLKIAMNKPQRPDCVSLVFSGEPGVGKSLAARYIAKELKKEAKIVPLASLMDKYVGQTEKAIKAAFDEAEKDGEILVIDEVDAISGDREGSRSYQVSMVNSLLQAMDNFKGICVFTTNSTKRMDPAVLRRCLLEVEFKNLTEEVANEMVKKFFPRRRISGLEGEIYAPADFSKVRDQLLFIDDKKINKTFLVEQLKKAAATRSSKKNDTAYKAAVGFKL